MVTNTNDLRKVTSQFRFHRGDAEFTEKLRFIFAQGRRGAEVTAATTRRLPVDGTRARIHAHVGVAFMIHDSLFDILPFAFLQSAPCT